MKCPDCNELMEPFNLTKLGEPYTILIDVNGKRHEIKECYFDGYWFCKKCDSEIIDVRHN